MICKECGETFHYERPHRCNMKRFKLYRGKMTEDENGPYVLYDDVTGIFSKDCKTHWQAEAERLQNESLRRLALAREWQNKYDVAVEQKILAYEDYVKISHELSTATALAEKYKGQRDEIIEAAESLVRTCKSFQSNIRTRDVENAITRIQDQDKENGL